MKQPDWKKLKEKKSQDSQDKFYKDSKKSAKKLGISKDDSERIHFKDLDEDSKDHAKFRNSYAKKTKSSELDKGMLDSLDHEKRKGKDRRDRAKQGERRWDKTMKMLEKK